MPPPVSRRALPNAAYAVLCASISARSLLDGSGSRPCGSVQRADAATVEATTALPEWRSKARRLMLDVANSPFASRAIETVT